MKYSYGYANPRPSSSPKKLVIIGIVAGILLLGLGLFLHFGSGSKVRELSIACCSGSIDSITARRFEETFSCTVKVDSFASSDDLAAKLEKGHYDLVFVDSFLAWRLSSLEDGFVSLAKYGELLPNLKTLDRKLLMPFPDQECSYSVPYMIGVSGLWYDASAISAAPQSWQILADPRFRNRTMLMDEPRRGISLALLAAGRDPKLQTPEDLAAAEQVLKSWSENGVDLASRSTFQSLVVANRPLLIQGYMELPPRLPKTSKAKYFFVIPEEGGELYLDVGCITRKAKDPKLACKFLNFLHDADVAKANCERLSMICPNEQIYPFIRARLANHPVMQKHIAKRCKTFKSLAKADSQKNLIRWNNIFHPVSAEVPDAAKTGKPPAAKTAPAPSIK